MRSFFMSSTHVSSVHVEFFFVMLTGFAIPSLYTITQPKRYIIGDMRLGDAGFGGIGTELDGYRTTNWKMSNGTGAL